MYGIANAPQSRLVNHRDGRLMSLQHLSQLFDRLIHVLRELCPGLIDKVLVFPSWRGDPKFQVRNAVRAVLHRTGHHDFRRARDRKKSAHREVVERAPVERLLDNRVLAVHAMILGAYSPAPLTRVLDDRVGRPPALPLARDGDILPHLLARRGDIIVQGHIAVGPRHLNARLFVFLPPRLFEVAQPELNVANDVDGFLMLDQSLRRRVDAHRLDTGVAVKRICTTANLLAYRVLDEPVDEDHITSSKLFASAHLLLYHLAVVDDELEIQIAHRSASFALAARGLLDVTLAPAELEIGLLDRVLQERVVDRLADRVSESSIAFELSESEGWPQAFDHRVHEIGDNVLCVLDLGGGEEPRIAGDVGDDEAGQFGLRKHVTSTKMGGTRPPQQDHATQCRQGAP